MNIGTMNIDNLMESITEEEAMEVVYQLTKKFDWKGSLFYSVDVSEYIDTYNDDYADTEQDKVTVEEVKQTSAWHRHMYNRMCQEGFDCLDDAIYEVKQSKKGE